MKKVLAYGIVLALLSGGRAAEAAEPLMMQSERGGIGLEEVPQKSGMMTLQSLAVDPRRSLAVTEKAIVSQFTLAAVMNQLTTQNGATGLNSAQLFRQLWDTQNAAPGQADLSAAVTGLPHCSDNTNKLNGFAYPCRTAEGVQAGSSSAVNMSSYVAVGLFNRFDMMSNTGSNCGEYRLVFAKTGATPGRNFIIFEATLPNPQPGQGREGCRAVGKFWADLTSDAVLSSRATKLKSFFFTGLPGFRPVIHMNNYGNDPSGLGQVRTNQFIGSPWLLREFKLKRQCPTTTTCTLKFVPATVKINPMGNLFNPNNVSTLASQFQLQFLDQVASLAIQDVNRFNYAMGDQFNAGQSDAQTASGVVDDYVAQFNAATTSTFRANIQARLDRIGSTLTPVDIVARAQALSCGGCHQRSSGAAMGGFTFPNSLGFVHSSERDDPADPTRFQLSPTLVNTFLPRRKAVLEGFLNTPVLNAAVSNQSVALTATPGQTLSVSITMVNQGTLSWNTANGIALIPVSTHKWNTLRMHVGTTPVHQGQATTFSFGVVAPTTPGTYPFQWRMARNDVGFGASTPLVNITVK
jgi:Ig-like domain from next to BRCA1 gene